jgi:hypothetical protein
MSRHGIRPGPKVRQDPFAGSRRNHAAGDDPPNVKLYRQFLQAGGTPLAQTRWEHSETCDIRHDPHLSTLFNGGLRCTCRPPFPRLFVNEMQFIPDEF